MKKLFSTLVAASQPLSSVLATGAALTASVLASSVFSPAFAVGPALQLNVTGGTYLGGTEQSGTNVNGSGGTINPFTLNALCQNAGGGPNQVLCTANNYFISIALLDVNMNPIGGTLPNFGSFDFGTTTFNQTNLSLWTQGGPAGLGGHGVFNPAPGTWYTEVPIGMFATSPKTNSVDVEPNPGFDPTINNCPNTGTCDMFYKQFGVNIANLSDQYKLHFDLYLKDGNGNVPNGPGDFAPFSHDVVSTVGGGGGGSNPTDPTDPTDVPEPSTLLGLIAFGTLIAGSSLKRK
ncbi:choice-of-anchor N protein [Crocosphaera sp. XPORK-15E]|uniref:choice-of-anchor N protein n=1 Tax=Crocosphaera sp. XPORK-15E TaxID=3110247 RepID=UPI002B20DFDE|nr:choice-of-anchor N protein [Crocosphaera sp. XPORK-15E]MEA5536500.1 choice-of-anchor N protein [Crocosphaera sp. XPORK-15E]